jgi:hypothetical protein
VLSIFQQLLKLIVTLQIVVSDCVSFCATGWRSRTALAAENLFLRKQLALFQEREKKAVRTTAADRFVLCKLARFFDWRSACWCLGLRGRRTIGFSSIMWGPLFRPLVLVRVGPFSKVLGRPFQVGIDLVSEII